MVALVRGSWLLRGTWPGVGKTLVMLVPPGIACEFSLVVFKSVSDDGTGHEKLADLNGRLASCTRNSASPLPPPLGPPR